MTLTINHHQFPVELMDTPEKIERGMMYRDSLNGCMVFKLKKGIHSFWMKNCNIPLDIVFVLNNRITKIHLNCPPSGSQIVMPHYNGIGDYVIEFPAGTASNFKLNEKVNFQLNS